MSSTPMTDASKAKGFGISNIPGFGKKGSKKEDDADPKKPEQASKEEVEALEKAEATSEKVQLYIKRTGYGNMIFYEGDCASGNPVYFVEVAKKMVGWDITLRKGGDKHGEPLLHLKKAVRFLSLLGWDKGSQMTIQDKKGDGSTASSHRQTGSTDGTHASKPSLDGVNSEATAEDEDVDDAPEELNPSYKAEDDEESARLKPEERSELTNELTQSMKQLKVANPEQAQPLAILQRKHAFRSNRNVFEFNGQTYAWDYKIFIGAMHTLTNLDTNEIVAVCQLKAGVTTQSITAWGLRQNGCLEILGSGRQMQDMIVATLIGMLEWRKHNNKVWIILLAAMPA